jgi:uncharacterized protein
MSVRLPVRLDPIKECHRQAEYRGSIPLAQMKRLALMLEVADASAQCVLRFSIQGKGRYRLEGQVQAELQLECQRCLQPMLFKVEREFRLALIQSEAQVEQLGERWDPLVLSEDTLTLAELIEDELILAVPDVPRHAENEKCQISGWQPDELEEFESKPENPFTVLAGLKKH